MSLTEGYVQVYTGDGKGKTTAALGLALRAAGAGLRVFIGQFVKGEHCSEHDALGRFAELVTVRRYGSGHFIMGEPSPDERRRAALGWDEARKVVLSAEYDVVILDEVCVAVALGVVASDELLELVRHKPSTVELVLTGRGAPPELVEAADLVTQMRAVKHYHAKGVTARRGIEK